MARATWTRLLNSFELPSLHTERMLNALDGSTMASFPTPESRTMILARTNKSAICLATASDVR